MQIIIESPRIVISDRLQELIETKLEHINKMTDRISKCVVVLKKEKNDQDQHSFLEITLNLPQKTLFASEHAETFEIALDRVVNDLANQLSKYKRDREANWKEMLN